MSATPQTERGGPTSCPQGRTDYEACFAPFRYCPVEGCGRAEDGEQLPTTAAAETGTSDDRVSGRACWRCGRTGTATRLAGTINGRAIVQCADECGFVDPASRGPGGEAVERVRAAGPVHYFDCDRFQVYDYGCRQGTCDCTANSDVEALAAAVDRLTAERDANAAQANDLCWRLTRMIASAVEGRDAARDLAGAAAFGPPVTFDEVSPSQQLNAENDFAGRPSFDSLLAGAATREDGTDGG